MFRLMLSIPNILLAPVFPEHVVGWCAGECVLRHAVLEVSVCFMFYSLSLKKSSFHTAQASQHNNYTKQSDNKIKDWKQQKKLFPKVQLMCLAKTQHQRCGSLPWGVFAHGQRASHQGTSVAVEMGNMELILTCKL